jgi:thiaminase
MSDFKNRYTAAMEPLIRAMELAPWEDQSFYANWLAQTYHFVVNSTRLIAFCGSFFKDDKLHQRFVDHAKEERNHEFLLTNDLKHLGGYKIETLPEMPITAGFYQSQLYLIMMKSPAAFFGYIFCLEGLAVDCGGKLYERTKAAHGQKAANFLKVHSDEDVDHLESAFKMLESLSKEEVDLVEKCLRQSAGLYEQILRQCAEKRNASKDQAAA